jgi:ankyrin repeat protein
MLQYKAFKDSLYFAHIFSRRDTIKAAHAKTCRWILEDPRFEKWNVSRENCHQHGFLWIAGKPGAGKSTLMKFLSGTKTMRPRKKHLTATFFFHARGHVLEKSISGMYRSLVLQLLEGFTDLQAIIHDSPIALDGYSNCPSNEKLKDVLKACILRLGKRTFTCFIDALDEGDEQQIIEMVRYFEDLAEEATRKKVLLRICFSSRHYPYIDIRHGTRLTLEDQAGHTEDMINYVKGHLRVNSPAPVADLHSELLRRSSGVFLWIVLVVDILNKEGRRGGFSIMTRLKEIPGDLRDLFADMLTRDQDNMHDLRLCIMWILFAKRPLTPAEFYHAMWSSLLAKGLADEDPPDPASKAFKIGARLSVINSSKGLAGVTTSNTPVVQFIHESVRDFLLKDNGLATIWPDFGEVQSHEIIKESCISYIQRAGDREEIDKVRTARRLPLLKYCSDFVFIHSEAAAESLSQGDFLSSFPIQKWVRVHNLFQGPGKYLHETSSRLVYLLAEMALPRLLRTRVQQRLETTGKGAERYKYPFFAAFASGSRATLAALLELSLSDLAKMSEAIDRLGFNSEQRTPLTWAISHGLGDLAIHLVKQGASLTESDPGHRTPLRMAIKVKEISLIEHFLGREGYTGSECPRNDAVATSARDQKATSHIAALLGLEPLEARKPLCSFEALEEPIVARRLLEAGAGLRDRGVRGNTPMGVASAHGLEETLELLIEAGGDINDDRDHEGRTPLFHAAVNGHQSTIELLIRSGARIRAQDKFKTGLNTRDASGNMPLHRALHNGHQELAKLLIDFGADLNACSRGGSRPLHLALMNGQESVAKYLVDHGADLNAGNLNGEIPLHWAVERGVLETAEMFINHEDANINLPDNSGLTPLHKAVASPRCNAAVVSFLLRYGADVAAKSKTGLTPLHLCASNRLGAITMTLLQHGAETDARDNRGLTPLYFAARAMDFPMTGLLRQHGADVNARNSEGSTLLHFASSEGDGTTAVTLINHGADVNARNNRGSTPLHVAAQGGKKEAARALINNGGDIDTRDIRGRTPGDIADRSIAHLFAV